MKTIIGCSLLLCAGALNAQVSESIDVRIVNVDVTVTSKGAPVRGLTRDDFEIFEDGRPQKITNFYSVDQPARPAAASAPNAPAAAAPAAVESDPRFRRKVLVLVDNRHTTRERRDLALRTLEAMINDRFHGEYEWSIGVIGRGITLILPLSSDKNAIHEALEIIRNSGTRQDASSSTFAGDATPGKQPSDYKRSGWALYDKNYTERIDRFAAVDQSEQVIAAKLTVPAYLDAVRGFATTSGRKIVLLMTGDPGLNDLEVFPHTPGNSEFTSNRVTGPGAPKLQQDQRTIDDLKKSIVQEANSSDVSFYIWNVQGLDAPGDLGGSTVMTNNSAVYWLSKQTGGRLVGSNNAAAAVQEFDTASSTFYSLGYAPSHPDDGKYHAIAVRMKRPGPYSLEYRSGYSGSPAATQLARAMTSPTAAAMQASAFPVSLAFGTPETAKGEVTLPIEVKVPFRELQFLPAKSGVAANLVIYVSVFDDTGKNLAAFKVPLTPGFRSGVPDPKGTLVYRNAVKLRKGERHRIVVAIRDVVTESVGMATQVVKF